MLVHNTTLTTISARYATSSSGLDLPHRKHDTEASTSRSSVERSTTVRLNCNKLVRLAIHRIPSKKSTPGGKTPATKPR